MDDEIKKEFDKLRETVAKLETFSKGTFDFAHQQQGQLRAVMAFQVSLAQTVSKNSPGLNNQLATRLKELVPVFKSTEPYYSDVIDMFLGCLDRDPDLPPDKPSWFRGVIDGGLSRP